MKRSTPTKKRSSANTKSKKARSLPATRDVKQRTSARGKAPRARSLPVTLGMPVLIVAGEESGDILGGAIVREVLKNLKVKLWGCGGKRMVAAGVEIVFTAEELATIGFLEAAKNYRRLTKIINRLVEMAVQNGTREAWLIDFPGFNMVLAKKLKEKGIRSTLIVSPTVWAWKYNRVFKIRDRFERVLCLYDFEPEIYNKIGVEAHYIGHPLTTETAEFKTKIAREGNPLKDVAYLKPVFKAGKRIVAIMPGSRPSEIAYHTQKILEGIKLFQKENPDLVFIIPAANNRIHDLLSRFELPENTYLTDFSAPYVLSVASAAIACSGTVTLECALFNVPHLILYRSSWMSYAIFKGLIKIPYIGMVNVLAGRFIVQEFLQHRLNARNIAGELHRILSDAVYRKTQQGELRHIARRLTAFEPAKQAARILIRSLKS